MLDGLVGKGELSKIVTDHVCLDFDTVPVFATVYIDDGADHIRDNNAVSEVGLNCLGLLTVGSLLPDLLTLLEKSIVSLVDAVAVSSSLSGSHKLDKLLS